MFGLLKIACKVLDQQQIGRTLYFQTRRTSSTQESRTNAVNTGSVGITNKCTNMTGYSKSSTNRKADKEAKRIFTNKIHNDFIDIFTGIGCFDGTFEQQVRDGNHL